MFSVTSEPGHVIQCGDIKVGVSKSVHVPSVVPPFQDDFKVPMSFAKIDETHVDVCIGQELYDNLDQYEMREFIDQLCVEFASLRLNKTLQNLGYCTEKRVAHHQINKKPVKQVPEYHVLQNEILIKMPMVRNPKEIKVELEPSKLMVDHKFYHLELTLNIEVWNENNEAEFENGMLQIKVY